MSPEAERIAEVREWMDKVMLDLRAARIDLEASPPLIEDALFHCQQVVAAAVGITSAAFAAAHGIPVVFPAYLLFGIALALVRHWSGGLWAPILAHAINNGVALFVPAN